LTFLSIFYLVLYGKDTPSVEKPIFNKKAGKVTQSTINILVMWKTLFLIFNKKNKENYKNLAKESN
jgi:hypothetical protein